MKYLQIFSMDKNNKKSDNDANLQDSIKTCNSISSGSFNKKRFKNIFICLIILFISFAISIFAGAVNLSVSDLFTGILNPASNSYKIFMYVRLPRTLAAMLAGSSLAVAGVIIQNVLNNPLAGPNIIGVNAGAGLGAVIFIAFFPGLPSVIPFAAFIGALSAMLITYFIAKKAGLSKLTLVLTGVALNAVINACIDATTTLYPDALISANSFKIGGFSGITLNSLNPSWIIITISIAIAYALHYDLDILNLGDETAKSLGMKTDKMKLVFLILASLLAGAAISFSGLIGFIGLLIPHAVRIFTGNYSKRLIPVSAAMGASFLMLCDTASRTIFKPFEIPVGIILSVVGGIFFLLLLIKRK